MNILYFAPISFEYLKQRPQYIAEELSKKHNVFYIEPTVSFITAFGKKALDFRGNRYDISDRLHIIRLDGGRTLPYRLKFLDSHYIFSYSEYKQLVKIAGKIDMIWVGYPGWYGIINHFHGIRVIYDIMDDCVSLTKDKMTKLLLKKTSEILEYGADDIVVSAHLFYEELSKKRERVFLVQNALPTEYVNNFSETKLVKTGLRKFVYVGLIAEWFDNASIEVISSSSENHITLVGPALVSGVEKKNLKYTGKVPKEKVPDYIKDADVCLYPFVNSELIDTINPVKIYEYLAFNKPVIARRSKETEKFEKYIYLYSDLGELKEILKSELKCPFDDLEQYNDFMKQNTWSFRETQIEKILEGNE